MTTLRRWRGLRRIAFEPGRDDVFVELLRPEQACERLACNREGVSIPAMQSVRIELVGFADTRVEDGIGIRESGHGRPGDRRQSQLNSPAAERRHARRVVKRRLGAAWMRAEHT